LVSVIADLYSEIAADGGRRCAMSVHRARLGLLQRGVGRVTASCTIAARCRLRTVATEEACRRDQGGIAMSRYWLGLLLLAVRLGAGGVAHASVSPADDPLELGTVADFQPKTASTTLTGNGSNPNLSLALHDSTPTGPCAEFSIIAPLGTFTLNNNNNRITVTIRLAPTSPGAKSCVIDVVQGSNIIQNFTARGTAQGATWGSTATPTPALSLDIAGGLDASHGLSPAQPTLD
jgi:hypothetical protein